MKDVITATFRNRVAAEEALRQLEVAGVMQPQISMIVTDETRNNHFKIETHSKADSGAATGATVGGVLGGVLAAILSAGVVVIPGLNLVVAGTLVAGLAGLGAGAATGGVIGALVGAGVPEHEAKLYEKELQAGGILIAVEAVDHEQKRRIKDIFSHTDAYNIAA